MSHHSAKFQEVRISLHSDSQETNNKHQPSQVEEPARLLTHNNLNLTQGSQPSSSNTKPKSFFDFVTSKMAMKFHIKVGQKDVAVDVPTTGTQTELQTTETQATAATNVSIKEDDKKSTSSPLSPFARFKRARKALTQIAKLPKSPTKEKKPRKRRNHTADKVKREVEAARMLTRIDDWANKFRSAIKMDMEGDVTGAYDAYTRY